MNRTPPPIYHRHVGTILIAQDTDPGKAAGRAIGLLVGGEVDNIDFCCIGAKANQQAMKAMTLFTIFVEEDSAKFSSRPQTLSFMPIHVTIKVDSSSHPSRIPLCHGTTWRTILNEKPSIDEPLLVNRAKDAPETPLPDLEEYRPSKAPPPRSKRR